MATPRKEHPYRSGRPTVWNAKLEAAIIRHLEKTGCSYHMAAEANGIHYSTLKERQNADPDFSAKLTRARARCQTAMLSTIMREGRNGNVPAAQWYLERTAPAEYGRSQSIKLAGDPENPTPIGVDLGTDIRAIAAKLATLSPAELREMLNVTPELPLALESHDVEA